jgi:hypothetical protein
MLSVLRWLAITPALALASVGAGCSPFDQAEGEVCDVNAPNLGSDDCQNGLSCQEAQGARTSPNPYRCCPGDLALAKTAVCALATSVVDASSAAPDVEVVPADASEAGAPSTDAAADVSAEGSQSASPEAAASDGPVE